MAEIIDQFHGEYQIDVQELSLLDQPEIAVDYEIWSTPAVIINGELAFTGRIKAEDLRAKLAVIARRDS